MAVRDEHEEEEYRRRTIESTLHGQTGWFRTTYALPPEGVEVWTSWGQAVLNQGKWTYINQPKDYRGGDPGWWCHAPWFLDIMARGGYQR